MRRHSAKPLGLKNQGGLVGTEDELMQIDISGAAGERYTKAYLDPIEWNAVGAIDKADLGSWIDVKTVNRHLPLDNCRLIFTPSRQHPTPVPDWAYVLVVPDKNGDGYWLVGWEWGFVLLKAGLGSVTPGRPSYSVKSNTLRSVHLLRMLHLDFPEVP